MFEELLPPEFCTGHLKNKREEKKKKKKKNGGESVNEVTSPVALLQCTMQITDVWTITVTTFF